MNVLSWALYAEGETDRDYLGTLLPRIIEDVAFASERGSEAMVPEQPAAIFGRRERAFDRAAQEICAAREAFVLLFVHGDTGGRGQQTTLDRRTAGLCRMAHDTCGLSPERCIVVAPRQATEAWCLADPNALRSALQLRPDHEFPELSMAPRGVEQMTDPKATAQSIILSLLRGRRRRPPRFPYTMVAQQQRLDVLRALTAVEDLYQSVRRALVTIGYR